jgi:bifunctional non-homologous end joining protein LigD
MSLREYKRKRNFKRTPEPGPKVAPKAGWSFVIQKHAASHLHYDFRLELDGVLKSWAVPKGPSLDTKNKRLAMHVEDHPVAYGDFEGIIPEGEYGGGSVMLWDKGTWEPIGDAHDGYRRGRLKFRLHGEKLQGGWMLVKRSSSVKPGKGNEWFLIKERDEAAQSGGEEIVDSQPLSVTTGRNLDQIAAAQDRVWNSNHNGKSSKSKTSRKQATPRKKRMKRPHLGKIADAVARPMPATIEPQLATLVKSAPAGDGWLHEIKFDGYRMLCHIDGNEIKFISRNQQDWTSRLVQLAAPAGEVPVKQAILDGEVVALKADGTSDFQTLQNAFEKKGSSRLYYYVFDLLYLNGQDLRNVPLESRKELLAKLTEPLGQEGALRYTEHIVGNGPEFFREAERLGLEGIICKRRNAPFAAGRSGDWLKVKCIQSDEFVIGGFTEPSGGRGGFGALLVGYHQPETEKLIYAGKVGTGFSAKLLKELRNRFEKLIQKESPFAAVPTGIRRKATWLEPVLVGQFAFSQWTEGGHLRHPSFLGLREDKPAAQVVRAEAKAAPLNGSRKPKKKSSATTGIIELPADVRLTHPEKVLYPDDGITKLELAQYYAQVADWMLPQVANRLVVLVRCPEGIGGERFYQKHPRVGTPENLRQVPVHEKNQELPYLVVDDVSSLISLVQLSALEIHVWGSGADNMEFPDRLIFDLDPDPAVEWSRVVESAHQIRAFLEELGLVTFVKTTGGKGLHIVAPVKPKHQWDQVKEFTKSVAEIIVQADPYRYTSNMAKAARTGKIFIDYLRNQRSATAIAPFSTRAQPGAPVSVPITWKELTSDLRSDQFTIRNVMGRLKRQKRDPWAEMSKVRQSLSASLLKKVEQLRRSIAY